MIELNAEPFGVIAHKETRSLSVFRPVSVKRKEVSRDGIHGVMPDRRCDLAAHPLHRGLQRLGHDVYYVEDSARLPYNPETFEVNNQYDYAEQLLERLAREFNFQNRWAFCARYLPENPTVGLSLKKIRELYRDADAILNICGTQEFNEDLLTNDRILYVESDPGVEQIKIDKGSKSTRQYLRRHHALFTFGENVGTPAFPVPGARSEMVADPTTCGDGFVANPAGAPSRRRSDFKSQLVDQRPERYLVAGEAISVEQIAGVSALCRGPEEERETFELATDIKEPEDASPALSSNGWRLTSPLQSSVDYWLYRDYIQL